MPFRFIIATTQGTTDCEFLTEKAATDEWDQTFDHAKRKKRTDLLSMHVIDTETETVIRHGNFGSAYFQPATKGTIKRAKGNYVPRKKHRTGSGITYNRQDKNGNIVR